MFAEQNAERNRTKPNETKQIRQESTVTEIRFNPHRVRRFGLSSTQEAKALLYLERHGDVARKTLSRVFDLRLVERLVTLGLVVRQGDVYGITENGKAVLRSCLGEDHGRGMA